MAETARMLKWVPSACLVLAAPLGVAAVSACGSSDVSTAMDCDGAACIFGGDDGGVPDTGTSDGATATSDSATSDGATSDSATSDSATSDSATSDGATSDGGAD
jgi:hypothetical protein